MFDLPREIRDQIYASYFSSITLTYPTFALPPLLFTSRQLHAEALPLLRSNATYDLITTEHFIDYLTTLSPATLAQLRHISVRDVPFPVYPDVDDSYYVTHLFSTLLPLFPGLRLGTLIIEDAFHGEDAAEDGLGHNATYDGLQEMVKEGKGWKELILRSTSDRWLVAVVFQMCAADGTVRTMINGGSKQPETWDRLIKERDGQESGAKVEMWSCKAQGVWEKVEEAYNAEVEDEAEQDDLDGAEPARSSIEVRVRRGKEADYAQDGMIAHERTFSRQLREMLEKLGWKEIKARGLFVPGAEDDPMSHL